ncbi:response regulator [Dyadobacter sp. NIV53]|uniref:response regulator n=1 Tax=Dyadobacter sp. NIV53 TaxID=2861765 RepID=UPI001C8745AC|nr:response regulator [Dyadobacter sp. NIV53]
MQHKKPLHLLLADDDNDDTFLFQEALKQIPISTKLDIAENGMDLMNLLKSRASIPDLIFLDMNMPVRNGLECLCEIRNSDQFRDIPVVILSTSIAGNLLESANKNGANAYIQKPTNFSKLVAIIEKCLVLRESSGSAFELEQFLIKNDTNQS